MFRVVNITTNTKIKESISSDPKEIYKLMWAFEASRKAIKLSHPDTYRENTSRCFEYKEDSNIIIVYIMDFN